MATVVTALVMVFRPGVADSTTRAACAAVAGVLLLAGAGSASRAVGDRLSATALGLLVAPCFALVGWVLPAAIRPAPTRRRSWAPGCWRPVRRRRAAPSSRSPRPPSAPPPCWPPPWSPRPPAISGALMGYTSLDAAASVALVATVVVLAAGAVAPFAFKLAGMRMPALPSSAGQLQEGIDPYAGDEVAERTELAGRWVTALFAATGTITTAALAVLAHTPDLPETLTALALALLLLLHSRGLVHIGQRLSLAVPGICGLLLLARAWAVDSDADGRVVVFAVLFAAAAALVTASWIVPGRRVLPYWGRAAELAHTAFAVALLPFALWVAGLFGLLRGLFG
ncbi:type VII secretion integral membrane protein EccD [Streptomyces sp. S063]|uniref:type VII secretion integral membrane protein EccD n=1 Tax=Streptomyces sp. S063 TaxID=2005885 RepID=UPI003FCE4ADF